MIPAEHVLAAFAVVFTLGAILVQVRAGQAEVLQHAAQLRDLLVKRQGALP